MAFPVESADFDGTNDYMTRGAGLTGAADSKSGILSIWLRVDGGNGTQRRILGNSTTVASGTQRLLALLQADNTFALVARNAANSNILNLSATSAFVAGETWNHVLSSWDLASAGSGTLFANDVNVKTETTYINDTIDYTVGDWSVGAVSDSTLKYNGCLCEVYFAPGQFLDFSVEQNRRKFRDVSGLPVDLGIDGATPTGTAPLLYLHLGPGDAVTQFATNRGTGGDCGITGALELGSSSPTHGQVIAQPSGNAGAFLASWEKLRPRRRADELQRSRGEFEVYVRAEELIALVAARHLDSDTDTMIADAMKEFESHYMRWDLEYVGDLIDERDRLVREREERKRKELEGRAGWLERRAKQERNKKT